MLTGTKIRQAKPAGKSCKLPDGGGLHLYVTPAGNKLWRYRYEFAGREKTLSIGTYPDVSLAEARGRRDEARGLAKEEMDPGIKKKVDRATAKLAAADIFEALAREWHALRQARWAPRHADDVIDSLERMVFPMIGHLGIGDITPPLVLAVPREIEARPAIDTAHRVRQRISAVFVYAITSGRGSHDPAAIVKCALAPLPPKRHQPAVTGIEEARQVLADAEAVPAHPGTKLALRLLALTAVRPGELRGATWPEFEGLDDEEPLWRVPAERMKGKVDSKAEHMVPLAPAAVEIIAHLKSLAGRSTLVFPSARYAHRPMSVNALGYMLNRAGYHGRHTPHGWRRACSTVMNERHKGDRHNIGMTLSHTPKCQVEAAYNRAPCMKRRRELAQDWADLLLMGGAPASRGGAC